MSESTLLAIASNYGYATGRTLDLATLTRIAQDENAHKLVYKWLVCESSQAQKRLSEIESYIEDNFLGKGTS